MSDNTRQFRKKPVVIEAIQWDGADVDSVLAFCLTKASVRRPFVRNESNQHYLLIETREGVMTAEKGDWIIKGVKGEFYPCKPDIFAMTYEPADERAADPAPSKCKWCADAPPEWSPYAHVWIHRRDILDRVCDNPPRCACGATGGPEHDCPGGNLTGPPDPAPAPEPEIVPRPNPHPLDKIYADPQFQREYREELARERAAVNPAPAEGAPHTSPLYGEQIKQEFLAIIRKYHVVSAMFPSDRSDKPKHEVSIQCSKLPPLMTCVLREYGSIYVEADGYDQPKAPGAAPAPAQLRPEELRDCAEDYESMARTFGTDVARGIWLEKAAKLRALADWMLKR